MFLNLCSLGMVLQLAQAQNSVPVAANVPKGPPPAGVSATDGLCLNNLCLPDPGSLLPLPNPLKPTESKSPRQPGTFITTETVISVQAGPTNTVTVAIPVTRTTTIIDEVPGPTVTDRQPTSITVTRTEGGPTPQPPTISKIEPGTTTLTRQPSTVTRTATEGNTTLEPSTRTGTSRTDTTEGAETRQTTGPTTTRRSTVVTVNGAALQTGAIVMGALFGGAAAMANL